MEIVNVVKVPDYDGWRDRKPEEKCAEGVTVVMVPRCGGRRVRKPGEKGVEGGYHCTYSAALW